jgi:hypothetical protein
MKQQKVKKRMVSFLIPEPILNTITDIENFEDRSRSSTIVRLVQRGLKTYPFQGSDNLVKQQ